MYVSVFEVNIGRNNKLGVELAVAVIAYEAAGLAGAVHVAVHDAVVVLFPFDTGIDIEAHVEPEKLPPVALGTIVTDCVPHVGPELF